MVDTDMKPRVSDIRQQPWMMRYMIYLIAACIIFGIFWIAGGLYPYEPYKFYGYANVPEEVCQGDRIRNGYIMEVVPGPYTVGHIEGEAYLVDSQNKPLQTYKIDEKIEPVEKGYEESYVQRSAPLFPGRFKLGSDVQVHGKVFGVVPNYQDLKFKSTQTITVLNLDDPKCEGVGINAEK